MEVDPEEFKTKANPHGVGPYFGSALTDSLSSKELTIKWCDGKTLAIDQVDTWLCPAPNKDKFLMRGKHPQTGMPVQITVLQYSKRGAKLQVQSYSKSASEAASEESPAKKKKTATNGKCND